MIPATELKTSVMILSLLQQIDLALFNKVFGYTRARHAVTQVALFVSKTGDGYAQLFLPLIVWLIRFSPCSHLRACFGGCLYLGASELLRLEEHAETATTLRFKTERSLAHYRS
jgi:hypothetical protein